VSNSGNQRFAPESASSAARSASSGVAAGGNVEGKVGARITGWGCALPEKVLTNADLERTLDTSDAWIKERTGISERRIGGVLSDLAAKAGGAALERAGLDPLLVDMLVMATTTPERTVPATSASVHHKLGLGGGAMDVNAACAGFVYALQVAHALVVTSGYRVLVIGADVLSQITDYEDRSTAILFGDGAGAVVLEPFAGPDSFLAWDIGADGSAEELLYCDHGGKMKMQGNEVFRRAVRVMVASAERVLEKASVPFDEVALFVPHQANIRIIEAARQRLGVPLERTAIVLDRTGNTSSASIPLGLCDALDKHPLQEGDTVLLSGFGAGLTWASVAFKWALER
jgi:3-oxoacyl-[acyl-carrier-protein] synthase-3